MLHTSDMLTVPITDAELAHCKDNPVVGCTRTSTGQLKAVGNMVVQKALEIPAEEFDMQSEAAAELGAAYVCEVRNGLIAGISPTVSTIRVNDVLTQRVVVPANQLYKHPYLNTHFTVGVFLNCDKDPQGELTHIEQATVAGWIHTNQLKRWIKKGGTPPFTVRNTSMAVAPCDVLNPMCRLLSTVQWKKFCV
jgi:hypothetical protein